MRLACYQPEIAGNMGAILRLSACFGIGVDVIEPCGFIWSEAKMRRAGMDYVQHVDVARHSGWEAFRSFTTARIILLTTRGATRLPDFAFAPDDVLLLGRESAGVPSEIANGCDATVRIPLLPQVRSLNISVAAGIAVAEALRQTQGLPA
ncbi:MAG: tRNA (cytidine(34)-2'-O)-methyltransferase [Sphingomonadales bacterium]